MAFSDGAVAQSTVHFMDDFIAGNQFRMVNCSNTTLSPGAAGVTGKVVTSIKLMK